MSTYSDASLIMYPSGYKENKVYCFKPTDGSGDLTFTRASTATRVNAAGLIEEVASGVPRIDYTGGGCGKLLLEPQRTNNLSYSQDFANVYWAKSDITFGADGVSPSGLTDADLIVTGTANSDQINRTVTLSATNTITQSVFIKRVAGADWVDFLTVRLGFTNSVKVWFNISTGAVGSSLQGGTTSLNSASIEDYGNGWLRLIVTTTDTTNNTIFDTRLRTATANLSDTRVNNSSYYLWGFQLEAGSYPTSYIPTTTTAVTRVGDNASKTPISSFLNTANPFTFYLNFQRAEGATPASYHLIGLDNGSYGEYIKLVNKSAQLKFYIVVKNSTTNVTSAEITNTPNIKIAIVYDGATSYKIFHNGALLQTLTLGACSLNRFASGENGIQFTTESYQSIMLFQTALSDTDAIALTTL